MTHATLPEAIHLIERLVESGIAAEQGTDRKWTHTEAIHDAEQFLGRVKQQEEAHV